MERPTLALSLTVKDGNAALDFYARAFDAKELYRMEGPNGSLVHSEFSLGNFNVYLSEEYPEWRAHAIKDGEVASCLFAIECDDCDEMQAQAIEAGAIKGTDPQDQIWGWRTAMVIDPFGYRWNLRTFLEDVSPEEMERRMQNLMTGG